jgi:asparagine synthase (glutamine-hydrolysing)
MCGIWFYIGEETNKTKLFNSFWKIQARGPNNSHVFVEDNVFIGFHRLMINDLTEGGNQPMHDKNSILICNGEIYNFHDIRKRYNLPYTSSSDCEAIIRLYNHFKTNEDWEHTKLVSELCKELDGEYAFIIYDKELQKVIVCRDRYGVRPLFIGTNTKDDHLGLASELKGLSDLFDIVEQFEPSTFMIYDMVEKTFIKQSYNVMKLPYDTQWDTDEKVMPLIRNTLVKAVEKRLISDRPICTLLSGGLDSSLVSALVSRYYKPFTLNTFSIGMEGSTDLKYARMVADYIQSVHHEVLVTPEEMLAGIEETIRVIESYDITTVRASAFNRMIAKYISENTEFRVLMTGEWSDENSGSYLYFRNAPSPDAFHDEANRLIADICFFDSLRADRCISANGLEARVPFSDKDYMFVMQNIIPELKMITPERQEKYLLRKAFEKYNLLPKEVLWRQKDAFSDATSSPDNSWHNMLKTHIDKLVSDKEFKKEAKMFEHNTPFTKEAYYYRKIFNKYYGKHDNVIPYFWMPRWSGDVNDPSARELK